MLFDYLLDNWQSQPRTFRFCCHVRLEGSRFDLFSESAAVIAHAKLHAVRGDFRAHENSGFCNITQRILGILQEIMDDLTQAERVAQNGWKFGAECLLDVGSMGSCLKCGG